MAGRQVVWQAGRLFGRQAVWQAGCLAGRQAVWQAGRQFGRHAGGKHCFSYQFIIVKIKRENFII